ncbi:ATP-binding protein [Kitasatospora sp. RB6PN24]|uniref:ATP-binding protein n=1 Tax=Kitasatospora humi TaxID=2893891 RepID=UPI001E65C261|nr:ATP-binding protein [Kitasatospora humi]MCC9311285.1 ATP-binding protein [Kitasatospora humi]
MTAGTFTTSVTTDQVARRMPCRLETVRDARRLVDGTLRDWGLRELTDSVRLLVSELVTNAVRHTGCTRIVVRLTRDGRTVQVSVQDFSCALPVLIQAGLNEERGRGMALVDRVSDRWGVDLKPFGKVVWAQVTARTRPA